MNTPYQKMSSNVSASGWCFPSSSTFDSATGLAGPKVEAAEPPAIMFTQPSSVEFVQQLLPVRLESRVNSASAFPSVVSPPPSGQAEAALLYAQPPPQTTYLGPSSVVEKCQDHAGLSRTASPRIPRSNPLDFVSPYSSLTGAMPRYESMPGPPLGSPEVFEPLAGPVAQKTEPEEEEERPRKRVRASASAAGGSGEQGQTVKRRAILPKPHSSRTVGFRVKWEPIVVVQVKDAFQTDNTTSTTSTHPVETSTADGQDAVQGNEATWDPRRCRLCGELQSRKEDMERHLNTKQHGGSKVPCNICGKFLSRDDALRRHKKDKHGVPLPPRRRPTSGQA